VPALFLLLLPALTLSPDLSIAYQGEAGVEARGLFTAGVLAGINPFVSFDAAVSFSLLPHSGLSGAAFRPGLTHPRLPGWKLDLGFQHQQWNDWQSAEDRLFFLLRCRPIRQLTLGLGVCRRLPFFTAGQRRQPLFPEWNLLYHLAWQLLNSNRLTVNAELSNYDRLEIKNPQQLPGAISTAYRFTPDWKIISRCQVGSNGLSTGLLSLTNLKMEIGVRYGK
jgi:hypothetical protein